MRAPERCPSPVREATDEQLLLMDLRTHPATKQPQRQRLQRPRARSSSTKDPLGAPSLLTWVKHSKKRAGPEIAFRVSQQNLTTDPKDWSESTSQHNEITG